MRERVSVHRLPALVSSKDESQKSAADGSSAFFFQTVFAGIEARRNPASFSRVCDRAFLLA